MTDESQRLSRIGGCTLDVPEDEQDEPLGYWVAATCAEYSAALAAAGGCENLRVWSALTDLDGQFGSSFVFTEWGDDEWPVAACGADPSARMLTPCEQTHALFVKAVPCA